MTTADQIEKLSSYPASFAGYLNGSTERAGLSPLGISTFQINVGKLCNQACKHCHVDAGPSRTEMMDRENIERCLDIISQVSAVKTVDITGGAPEMNPHFCYLVEKSRSLDKHVIDRCNLTILEEKNYEYLYSFLRDHRVEITASLPHYSESNTDKQRGSGVHKKSIRALKKLNELGYGEEIELNLVYNPVGIYLASSQRDLEREFKEKLASQHGIVFNNLYCINNMPISRYLEALLRSEKFDLYMETLVNAFNPSTVEGLMCRDQISVGWDGQVYDCDFNQMLDIKSEPVSHIKHFDYKAFISREIKVGNHCFGCTAGAGSSCGGELVQTKEQ